MGLGNTLRTILWERLISKSTGRHSTQDGEKTKEHILWYILSSGAWPERTHTSRPFMEDSWRQ